MADQDDSVLVQNFQIALVVVGILWAVHLLNFIVPIDFRRFGIIPRNPVGLIGIAASPFLHGSFQHLSANSGTLLFLLAASLSFSRKQTLLAIPVIMVAGGGAVWLFGSYNIHIGASGVIFGLLGFLLFIGIFQRSWKALIFSIVIFIAYGGVLISLLRFVPGVSWSGHFFGFLSGVLAAWFLREDRGEKKTVVDWRPSD